MAILWQLCNEELTELEKLALRQESEIIEEQIRSRKKTSSP